jgi:hypothetical protein
VNRNVPRSANLKKKLNKNANNLSDLVKLEREEDFHRVAKIRGGLGSSKKHENLSKVENVIIAAMKRNRVICFSNPSSAFLKQ